MAKLYLARLMTWFLDSITGDKRISMLGFERTSSISAKMNYAGRSGFPGCSLQLAYPAPVAAACEQAQPLLQELWGASTRASTSTRHQFCPYAREPAYSTHNSIVLHAERLFRIAALQSTKELLQRRALHDGGSLEILDRHDPHGYRYFTWARLAARLSELKERMIYSSTLVIWVTSEHVLMILSFEVVGSGHE
jgi:hypothetical protein